MAMEELIRRLKEVQPSSQMYVAEFEGLLQKVAELRDPASICPLITLLEDNAPYDEVMFSIIHVIETFDDVTFVEEILRSLPNFVSSSPRWAAIIHMRILNSPNTLEAYARRLATSEADVKRAAKEVLTSVARKRPEFQKRVTAILGRLGPGM